MIRTSTLKTEPVRIEEETFTFSINGVIRNIEPYPNRRSHK